MRKGCGAIEARPARTAAIAGGAQAHGSRRRKRQVSSTAPAAPIQARSALASSSTSQPIPGARPELSLSAVSNIAQESNASAAPFVSPRRAPANRPGEFWVQITICIVVTGLLLAIVALPKAGISRAQRERAWASRQLSTALGSLRSAAHMYQFDHGLWPGAEPTLDQHANEARASASAFERQMTMSTDAAGRSLPQRSASHPYGPYLEGGLPVNPINGLSTLRVLADTERWPAQPDGSTGWIYQQSSGRIAANCAGETDGRGIRYFDL